MCALSFLFHTRVFSLSLEQMHFPPRRAMEDDEKKQKEDKRHTCIHTRTQSKRGRRWSCSLFMLTYDETRTPSMILKICKCNMINSVFNVYGTLLTLALHIDTCVTVISTLRTVITTRAYARKGKRDIYMSSRWCQQNVEHHQASETHAFSINTQCL